MKKINLIITLMLAVSLGANAINEVTVTGATGIADGTGYTTLSAAMTAIGTSQSGNTINVAINASTTEPNTGVSIGAGTWTSLTIYPTGDDIIVTAAAPTANLITFNGADNVSIDGRKNKTGTSRNLTITSPAIATYATIAFTAIAQSNTVKYCTIKGSVDGAVGVILFGGTAAATNGNGLNTIDNNLITNSGTRPRLAIYAPGNATNPTVGINITNNEFKDIINTSIASPAYILIGGGTSPMSSNWAITGNSFYETSTLNMSYSAGNTTLNFIQLGTTTSNFVGNNNNISNNYFGGTAKECGGGVYTVVSADTKGTIHSGIYLCTVTGGTNSIQNNTFQKINWTNKINGVNWRAIDVYGAGNYDIGTITGNTIGDNKTTESIVFNTDGGTNAGCSLIGIQISTTGNVAVKNNKIGSLKAYNSNSSYPAPITCIVKNTTAGTVDITDNMVGSNSTVNSIQNNQSAGTTSNIVSGIKIYSTVAGNNISNNTIANLTTGGATSMVEGIFIGGPGASGTASGTTTFTVNGNQIHSLFSSAGSAGAQVNGIYINNYVITATCTNNIITLNSDLDNQVCGFLNQTYAYATKLYHNTVYIYGTGPTGSARRTAGLWTIANSANSNIDVRNNLFYNNRGGAGTNSAINFGVTTGGAIVCNYNNLYALNSNSVGVYNNAAKTYLLWQAVAIPVASGTYLPDLNSTNLNPTFAISNPLFSDAYYPGNSSLVAGANLSSTVTADYNNTARPSTPTIGALEYGKAVYDGLAWNVGSAPASASTDAALTGNYSGAGFTCKNLTVNAGKQTTITEGTLAVNGDFTLRSDAGNGTATFIDNGGTLTVTGASKVEQYNTSGRNWYFASPLSGDNSSVFDAAGANKMYSYAESSKSWTEITDNTTSLADMTGYIANVGSSGVVTFTGGSLNTGEKSATNLSYTSGDKAGYHLLGNPYPSYLSWTGATRSNVDATVWYRTKNTNGTYVFDTYNGTGTNNNGLGAVTANIPPMQAFWVRVLSAGNGSVSVDNADRSHRDVSTNNFRAPKLNDQKILRLQVSNGINSDEAILAFNPAAQISYDDFDAFKMSNNNREIPEIYTMVDNNELVINGMPGYTLNDPITLGFRPGKTASFNIKATEWSNADAEVRVMLIDNLTGSETDITAGDAYNFESDATETSNRFSLIFRSPAVTTDLTDQMTEQALAVYQNAPGQLTVVCNATLSEMSAVTIYSLTGQRLMHSKLSGLSTRIDLPLKSGIYLVQVQNAGKSITRKINFK